MHVAAVVDGHPESGNGKAGIRAVGFYKSVNSTGSERNRKSETEARDRSCEMSFILFIEKTI